ncbi:MULTISPECIES: hypothetical protein [Cyanophyceae]|uniref:hypothetical protein n=1 Tax=Cyanophyceae TaxID=3028117 RepID=UPI00168968BD|nr:hypothetical protein [Trichocoleus sp. FACHB-40]MBD2001772.1 hypothetical protein [Trichocoleus sp. FACHB-40]
MTVWHKLSAEEAHIRYKVPLDIAMVEENDFFDKVLQPWNEVAYDGPWSLLVFLRNQEYPNVITFQICHIEPEALEFEAFNPLTDEANFLYLGKQQLVALVDLLLKYVDTIQPRHPSRPNMFKQLGYSNLVELRFQGEWFSDSRQEFYYQVDDPLAHKEKDSVVTILTFSTGRSQPASHLFFSITQFPLQSLQDPSFNPRDKSLARINLNKSGLEELASLLQAQISYLADSV